MGIKRKIKNYIYVKTHYPLTTNKTKHIHDRKTILIINALIPSFDRDSGSNRITEIAIFLSQYYNVYFIHSFSPIPKLDEKKYIENFARHNVSVYTPFINRFGIMRGKNYFLKKLIPKLDFVWFHGPDILEQYLIFFKRKAPTVKIIYDMIDIHFLRMGRGQYYNADQNLSKQIEHYKYLETEFSKKADKIAVISEEEKNMMKSYIDESKLSIISNIHNLKKKPSQLPTFDHRAGIFFIGSFLHKPNVDAVIYLFEKIMPIVWNKLPQLNVTIIGQNPPDEIKIMDSERFKIKGFVENLIPYLENTLASVSPLRYGAGVKGKIGQSLEYSLPVVTTKIGAEGMFLEHKLTALISDTQDPITFAENIIEICTNKNTWETIHNNSEKAIQPFTIETQKNQLLNLLS